MIQHNRPDGTRCQYLGKPGKKCLHCGTMVGRDGGLKQEVMESISREDLEPEPTTMVGRMQRDLRHLMEQCTCGKGKVGGNGDCSACKKSDALRVSIQSFQDACEHEEIDEDPTNPFEGICKSCGAGGFPFVDEFDPLGRGPEEAPNRQDWRVAVAAMRKYLSNEDLVAELKRRGGAEISLDAGQFTGRYVGVPKTEHEAPERPPSLDEPCPHPVRKGQHELYVDPNKRGAGGKMAAYCAACGARGFV